MEHDGPLQHPSTIGPWFYATLLVPCATCNAVPGERCSEVMHTAGATRHGGVDVRVARRIRPRYHLARYERARDIAGVPIKRDEPRAPTSAAFLLAQQNERDRVARIMEDAARRIRSGSC